MLTSFDSLFHDLDRLNGLLSGYGGTAPRWMPVDTYRRGDEFVVNFDLPGVDPESVDVTVDNNVLSVTAERHWAPGDEDQVLMAERPQGRYSRQLLLSDNLEADHIDARYDQGVLTLTIPVAESAKPRKIQISSGGGQHAISTGSRQS
ncbi:Hsp20/alpha crystallin family protein [Acidiferrimicrobium sp. IK]|nr:Hsp20/alpha crystallin family protein [Acidiferrimicrobium sp. IK]